MKETPKRVMYQKTFSGMEAKEVDDKANEFRERDDIRAMYTHTHVISEGRAITLFVTVVFYTRKI